MKFKI